MKKKLSKKLFIVAGILLVGIIAFVTYKVVTKNPIKENTLEIQRTVWSGWNGGSSKKTTQVVPLTKETQRINLGGLGDDNPLTVTISADGLLDLSVIGLSLKQGSELKRVGMNLNACGIHTFTMQKNEKVELNTCTMDAGVTYVLIYR